VSESIVKALAARRFLFIGIAAALGAAEMFALLRARLRDGGRIQGART